MLSPCIEPSDVFLCIIFISSSKIYLNLDFCVTSSKCQSMPKREALRKTNNNYYFIWSDDEVELLLKTTQEYKSMEA